MAKTTKPTTETTAAKLWVVLARAHNSLASFVARSAAREGIGLSDFMVLEVLLHKGSLTISAIGEKVLLTAPSMTSAIDRLEELQYVLRRVSKVDRRIRLVELTPKGRKFIQVVYRRHAQSLEKITNVLSPQEREQLRTLLKKWGLSVAGLLNAETESIPKKSPKPPRKKTSSAR